MNAVNDAEHHKGIGKGYQGDGQHHAQSQAIARGIAQSRFAFQLLLRRLKGLAVQQDDQERGQQWQRPGHHG